MRNLINHYNVPQNFADTFYTVEQELELRRIDQDDYVFYNSSDREMAEEKQRESILSAHLIAEQRVG